jgi:hypothetical protein
MKIRSGFVSNSSSSSFICDTKFSIAHVKEKLEKIWDMYKELYEDSEDEYRRRKAEEKFEDIFGDVGRVTNDYLRDSGWRKHYKEELKGQNGNIYIESVCDNSIPYELYDIIVTLFNAERLHLG